MAQVATLALASDWQAAGAEARKETVPSLLHLWFSRKAIDKLLKQSSSGRSRDRDSHQSMAFKLVVVSHIVTIRYNVGRTIPANGRGRQLVVTKASLGKNAERVDTDCISISDANYLYWRRSFSKTVPIVYLSN